MMLSHIIDYYCIHAYVYFISNGKLRYIIPFSSLWPGWGVVTKSHSNKRLAVQWNAWSRSSGSRCLFGLYPHASWQAVSIKDCRSGHSQRDLLNFTFASQRLQEHGRTCFCSGFFGLKQAKFIRVHVRVNIELGKKLLKGQLNAIRFISSVTFSGPTLCRRRVRNNMDVAIWINLGKIFKMLLSIDRNDTSHTSGSSNGKWWTFLRGLRGWLSNAWWKISCTKRHQSLIHVFCSASHYATLCFHIMFPYYISYVVLQNVITYTFCSRVASAWVSFSDGFWPRLLWDLPLGKRDLESQETLSDKLLQVSEASILSITWNYNIFWVYLQAYLQLDT